LRQKNDPFKEFEEMLEVPEGTGFSGHDGLECESPAGGDHLRTSPALSGNLNATQSWRAQWWAH